MAGDVLGHGRIIVEVEEHVARDLARAEADFERAMRRMDRKEATLDLDANLKPLQKKVKEAEKRLAEYRRQKAEATLEVDTKKAEAGIKRWEKKLHERRTARDEVKLDTKQAEAQLRKLQALEDERSASIDKFQRKVEDGERRVAKTRADYARRTAEIEEREAKKVADRIIVQARRSAAESKRINDAANAAKVKMWRDEARAHEQALKMDRDRDAETRKSIDSVSKLQLSYLKAFREADRLGRAKTPFSSPSRQRLEAEFDAARDRVHKLHDEIVALGGTPIRVRVDSRATRGLRRLLDTFSEMGTTAIRLGPLTTSLAGLMKSLIVLGPIVTSLAGSIGSLIGVTGAGLVGAFAVGGGAAAGFGLALGGMVGVIKPAVTQLQNIQKASKAYNDTVAKNGKGSDKAKKKLAELNSVMGHQSKAAREAFTSWGAMGGKWKELTAPARGHFFNMVANGIKAADKNMGWFSGRTNHTFKELDAGTKKWIDGLNSPQAQNIMKGLFDDFNKSLPHLMSGLGNVGAYLAKVFSVGSKEGVGLSRTFENWAKRLNQGFDASKVREMVGYAKDLGRFLLAAGRALTTFFGLGAHEGANFLNDMTRGLDEWTARMQADGSGIQEFFKNSRENTEALWSALKPIGSQFLSWSANLAPFVTMLLRGTALVTSFVAGVLRAVEGLGRLVGLNGAASTLLATLGILWGVGRVAAFAAAIGRVVGMLRALVVAGTAARVAMTGLTGAAAIKAGATAGIAAFTARTAAAGTAAEAATVGVTGLSAGAVAATGGLAVLAAGVGYGIYKLLTMKSETEKLNDAIRKNAEATRESVANTRQLGAVQTQAGAAIQQQAQGTRTLATAKSQYNSILAKQAALEDKGKKNSQAWKNLEDQRRSLAQQLTGQLRDRTSAERQRQALEDSAQVKAIRAMKTVNQVADAQKNYNKTLENQRDFLKNTPWAKGSDEYKQRTKAVTDALAQLRQAERAQKAAQDQLLISNISMRRGLEGLPPVVGKAAAALAQLKRQGQGHNNLAMKIGLKFIDPKDVQRVAASASRALKGGASQKVVMKIVADSKSAEEALARLARTNIRQKKLDIVETGGKAAVRMVERINGKKLTTKQAKTVEKGGAAALRMIATINQKRIAEKKAQIRAVDKATAIIANVIRLLSQVQSRSATITTTYVTKGSPPSGINSQSVSGGGPYQHRAAGGSPTSGSAMPRGGMGMVAHAYERAQNRAAIRNNRGMVVNSPRLLIGEETRREYVIATNPAYRERNIRFLREAADELGVEVNAAPTGKAPSKGSPGKSNKSKTSNSTKGKTKLPTKENRYSGGGIPLEDAQTEYTTAKSWYDSRESRLKSLDKQVKTALANMQGKKGKAKEAAQRHLKAVQHDRVLAKNGEKGARLAKDRPSEAALKKRMGDAKKHLTQAKKWDSEIKEKESQANQYSSIMEKDAILYNKYGRPADLKHWQDIRAKREKVLTDEREIYKKAAKLAKSAEHRRDMLEKAANADLELTQSQEQDAPGQDGMDMNSLEGLLAAKGATGWLNSLLFAREAAKLDNVKDDPNTVGVDEHLNSLQNDKEAAQALQNFYQLAFDKFAGDPSVPTPVKTELVQALLSAKDDVQSVMDEINGTDDAGAQINQSLARDTERYSAMKEYGSNAFSAEKLAAAGVGSDLSGGVPTRSPFAAAASGAAASRALSPKAAAMGVNNQTSGGQTVQKTVNIEQHFSQPPPDPHSWSQGMAFEAEHAF